MTTYDVIRNAYDLVYTDIPEKVPFIVKILKGHRAQKVLELGSGSGLYTIPLKQAGFDIEGLEISPEMIAFCQQKYPALKVHEGNIQYFDLNQKFDAILLLSSTLVLLDDHGAIGECLQQVHQHLPTGGMLFLELPNHQVEVRESNYTQEVHTNEDQSISVVIQSQVVEKYWREYWYIFRQYGESFAQEKTVCDELLYSPDILGNQLDEVGFAIVETYGDLFGKPFVQESSWRRVWVCHKK